jgi:hypothetical protein
MSILRVSSLKNCVGCIISLNKTYSNFKEGVVQERERELKNEME